MEKPLIIQYAYRSPDPLKPPIWDSAIIRNISFEGVLLNTSKIFNKNEKLLLRFIIPTDPSNRLELEGEVIESLIYRTRIKFINLDDLQKKAIKDYVISPSTKPIDKI